MNAQPAQANPAGGPSLNSPCDMLVFGGTGDLALHKLLPALYHLHRDGRLPADMRIDRTEALVTPTDRAGVQVRFAIAPLRAASVRLVDAQGEPLPLGSHVRVTNPTNGKSVVVRINDRGPFARGRVLDLSKSAASEIGLVARGSGRVELAVLD